LDCGAFFRKKNGIVFSQMLVYIVHNSGDNNNITVVQAIPDIVNNASVTEFVV
jgi:hypothetical protein